MVRHPRESSAHPPRVPHSKDFAYRVILFCGVALILAAPSALGQTSETLEKPVSFSASDSLVIRFGREEGDRGHLIGAASVTYGEIRLQAHTVDILFDEEELRAYGLPSDTGLVGAPQFTQGSETFAGSSLAYNMGTGQGRVVGARTQFQEGFIQAGVAKVRQDSSIFIQDGLYTTCNCAPDETPSYSLRARKMKVVDQKWVYTGPIQLFIFNIPTPLWLPFGFLPYQEGRRSGLLAPEYGEDQRGFYLRNWGWYWALNDYLDLQLRMGLWTKGSWQIHPSFRYNRRDRYSGALSIDFLREQSGENFDPDLVVRNNISLRWSHNQTLDPTSRLTANVNLTSSSYLKTVSDQYDDNIRQSIGSSVQFNKRFRGGRSLSLNLRQNQVLSTGNTDMTLPELSFSQSTSAPFKRAGGSRDQRWYERLQYGVTSRMSNRFSFRPLTEEQLVASGDTLADGSPVEVAWYEALFDQSRYEQATGRDDSRLDFRATHRVPISAPIAINRLPLLGQFRLNFAPNANYTEEWFLETDRRVADSTGIARRRAEGGFFALRQFSVGASANTTFYGLFPIKVKAYQGLRHTVRPRIGFSFRPDFSGASWGYSRALVDENGAPVIDTLATGMTAARRYNIVSNVQGGLQQAVSFGVNNTFETKRVRTDSTGEDNSRVLKLFNVNLSSSFNFAADSLRMAPIRISARTNVLGKLSLNLSSTLSPYGLNTLGTRTLNDYVLSLRKFRFARMTQLSIRGDFRINGGRRRSAGAQQPGVMPAFGGASGSLGVNDPFASRAYGSAAASSNWSINVSFGYRLSRPLTRLNRSATVNTGFNFSLTPTWRARAQTGYDFEAKNIVTTTINISKEFECWEMAFSWIPFGGFQSWGFDLHVKSGRLSEFLRLRQPKADRDRRFGR